MKEACAYNNYTSNILGERLANELLEHAAKEYLNKLNLKKGEPLPPNITIVFLGNANLQPQNFNLREADTNGIGTEIKYPGISASIFFTESREATTQAVLGKPAKTPKNNTFTYFANESELEKIGYKAFYYPTKNNPLHTLVVHQNQINDPYNWLTPFEAKKALVNLLNRNRK